MDWSSLIVNGTLGNPVAGGASASSAPNSIPVLTVTCSEPVVLLVDLWAFQTAGSSPQATVGRGALQPGDAGGSVGMQWSFPRPYGDLTLPGYTGAPLPLFGVTSLTPTGYRISPSSLVWNFSGYPVGSVHGGPPPAPHAVTLSTPSASLSVPRGLLLAGYVYRVTVTGALNATWDFAPLQLGWGGADAAPFAKVSRRMQDAPCNGCTFQLEDSCPQTFSTARAPLLYIHTPPVPQSQAEALVLPASGKAATTLFTASTGAWLQLDGSSAIASFAPLPVSRASAQLSSALPLPYSLTRATAAAFSTGAAPSPEQLNASSACAGFPSAVSSAGKTSSTPWQAVFSVLAASLGGTAANACLAAVRALAGVYDGTSYRAPPAPLLVSFRALQANFSSEFPPDLAGIIPSVNVSSSSGGALAAVPWGGLLAAQSMLANPFTWPGSPLSALSISTSASFYLSGASPTAPQTVIVAVFVANEAGATGVAYAEVALSALISPAALSTPSGVLAAANSLTDQVSALAELGAASPFSSLQALQGCAGAVGALTSAALGASSSAPNNASDARVLLAVQAVAANISASISQTLSAIASQGGRSANGSVLASTAAPPLLSDGAMGGIVGSLGKLTSASSLLTPAAASSVMDALATGLRLSLGTLAAASPPFPLTTGIAVLEVLSNVVAGTVNSSSESSSSSNFAVMSTIPLLGSALLRAASPGDPPIVISTFDPADVLTLSSPGSSAAAGNGTGGRRGMGAAGSSAQSYCGSAVSIAAARLTSPDPLSRAMLTTSLSKLIPPCLSQPPTYSEGSAQGSALPGMAISAPLFASLNAAGLLKDAFDVHLTQWSNPPMTLKGIRNIIYASAPTVALGTAGSGGRRTDVEVHGAAALGARIAGRWGSSVSSTHDWQDAAPGMPSKTSTFAQLASAWEVFTLGRVGGVAAVVHDICSHWRTPNAPPHAAASAARRLGVDGGAIATSLAALAASLPMNKDLDLLPDRPLDTRVLSAELVSAGAVVQTGDTALPFFITLPLRDTSILRPDTSSVGGIRADIGQGQFVSPVINFSCPSSPAEAWAGIRSVYAFPPAWAGSPAPAAVLNITDLLFNSPVVSATDIASGAGGSGLASLGSNPAGSTLSAGGRGAPSPSPAPVAALTEYAYTLSLPCGGLGNMTILCGPGSHRTPAVYRCPAVTPVPACLHWDEAASAWSNRGCTVAKVEAASITCSCTHLGNLAARYVAARAASANVFAVAEPIVQRLVVNVDASLLLLLVCLGLAAAAAAACYATADAQAFLRYGLALSSDPEMRFLRQLTEAQGKAWVMDRVAAGALEGVPNPLVYAVRSWGAVALAKAGAPALALAIAPPTPVLTRPSHYTTSSSAVGSEGLEGGSSSTDSPLRLPKEEGAFSILSALPGGAFSAAHSRTFAEATHTPLAALFLRLLQSLDSFRLALPSAEGGAREGAQTTPPHGSADLLARFMEGTAPHATASTLVHDPALGLSPEATTMAEGRAFAARGELSRLVQAWRGSSGNCCLALWSLRGLLFWTAALRTLYTHPLLSFCTRFDPLLPRSARATILLVCATQALFTACFAYAFFFGRPGLAELPSITTANCAVIALVMAATSACTFAAATALFQWAGWHELQWRFPAMAFEYRRREAAARLLQFSPTAALLRTVREGSTRAAEGAGLCLLEAAARGELTAPAAAPPEAGPQESVTLSSAEEGGAAAGPLEPTALSSRASMAVGEPSPPSTSRPPLSEDAGMAGGDASVAIAAAPNSGAASGEDKGAAAAPMRGCDEKIGLEEANSGWLDPPVFCMEVLPELVRWCQKGAAQKAAHLRAWASRRAQSLQQQVAFAIERRRGKRAPCTALCACPTKASADCQSAAGALIARAALRGVDMHVVLLEDELLMLEEEERAMGAAPRVWSRDAALRQLLANGVDSPMAKPWLTAIASARAAARDRRVAPAPAEEQASSAGEKEGPHAAVGVAVEAEGREKGGIPAVSTVGCVPETLVAYAMAAVVIAWCSFFILLFSLLHGRTQCMAIVAAFFLWALFALLLAPLYTCAETLFAFIIYPTMASLVGWLPFLGTLTGAAAHTLSVPFDAPGGALVGRLRHVLLLRGAAQASLLPPDVATAAFTHPVLLSALLQAAALKAAAKELDDPFLAAARARRLELQLQQYSQCRLDLCYLHLALHCRARDAAAALHSATCAELGAARARDFHQRAVALQGAMRPALAAMPQLPMDTASHLLEGLASATASAESLLEEALRAFTEAMDTEATSELDLPSPSPSPTLGTPKDHSSELYAAQLQLDRAREAEAQARRALHLAQNAQRAAADLQAQVHGVKAKAEVAIEQARACLEQAEALGSTVGALVESVSKEHATLLHTAHEFQCAGASTPAASESSTVARSVLRGNAHSRLTQHEAALDCANALEHERALAALRARVQVALGVCQDTLALSKGCTASVEDVQRDCAVRVSEALSMQDKVEALAQQVASVVQRGLGGEGVASELQNSAREAQEAASQRVEGILLAAWKAALPSGGLEDSPLPAGAEPAPAAADLGAGSSSTARLAQGAARGGASPVGQGKRGGAAAKASSWGTAPRS